MNTQELHFAKMCQSFETCDFCRQDCLHLSEMELQRATRVNDYIKRWDEIDEQYKVIYRIEVKGWMREHQNLR